MTVTVRQVCGPTALAVRSSCRDVITVRATDFARQDSVLHSVHRYVWLCSEFCVWAQF